MAWTFPRRRKGRKSRVRRDPSAATIAKIQRMALRVAKLRGKSRRDQALVLADYMEEAGWPKYRNKVPTGRKTGVTVFDVWSLDVWGNAEDGFDINNQYRVGTLTLPRYEFLYNVEYVRDQLRAVENVRKIRTASDYLDEDLWRRFKKKYLASGVLRNQVEFEDQYPYILVNAAKDGEPLFRLDQRGAG